MCDAFGDVSLAVLFGILLLLGACRQNAKDSPPRARIVPHRLEKHGHTRIDNYYWLRNREDPAVLEYLKAENEYTAARMAHTAELQEALVREFEARIPQSDVSAPYRRRGYYYYQRTLEGKDYPIYCRKRGSLEAPEEVILDANEVAAGRRFCAVTGLQVSSDQSLLAYAVDTVGRRFYELRIRDLRTGEELADRIPQMTGNFVWANDNRTIFYVRQDPGTLRPYRVYRHELGADPASDELVWEERDETFTCHISKTKSEKFILIASRQTLSTEYRYLDASEPKGAFRLFLPRRRGHEYEVDHAGEHFYIRTNHEARNFRLMRTPEDRTALEAWQEVIPHQEDALLEGFELFRDHLVAVERRQGLLQLRIRASRGGEHYLDFGEPAYAAYPVDNYELDTPLLRYNYSSLTTPNSVYDYDMQTRERRLVKRDAIGGGFDPAHYRTERLWAPARDGQRVPISLVYRLPFERDGRRPLLLRGYGAYGISSEPRFDPYAVSLLDRGFVYAIAHVRGGQELGRAWYEDGKLLRKKNTFTDFIDCAEFLIREKYADPARIFAWGGSAGGLLVGAVVTMRPDLFTGAIAEVPFVDVLTTMLDESIPLTTNEYDEWGNPNEKVYYDYILSYSPYDQTVPGRYPHLLVTAGLHDSQVQYWEPAKWVAKLRAVKQDDHLLLLKTEMEAGHGGLTARQDTYRERAFRYAFLLELAGAAVQPSG
jgi:oligopeptidase B